MTYATEIRVDALEARQRDHETQDAATHATLAAEVKGARSDIAEVKALVSRLVWAFASIGIGGLAAGGAGAAALMGGGG